jgi:hypothetical protein
MEQVNFPVLKPFMLSSIDQSRITWNYLLCFLRLGKKLESLMLVTDAAYFYELDPSFFVRPPDSRLHIALNFHTAAETVYFCQKSFMDHTELISYFDPPFINIDLIHYGSRKVFRHCNINIGEFTGALQLSWMPGTDACGVLFKDMLFKSFRIGLTSNPNKFDTVGLQGRRIRVPVPGGKKHGASAGGEPGLRVGLCGSG